MLTYEQALDQLGHLTLCVDEENVPTLEAAGRILARPVPAAWPLPRFTNSAMDGYAVRQADITDIPAELPLAGESAAGHPFAGELPAAAAIRISTGAALPPGADSIVPIEHTESLADDRVRILRSVRPGQYVRHEGEDIAAGAPLLARGTILRPQTLAFLAMFNPPTLPVLRRPVVAIVGSGDEVKRLGESLGPTDVVGVNLYYLENELRACGCDARIVGIAPDNTDAATRLIGDALATSDAIITVAGVSVGEHDIIGAALQALGAEVLFWRVSVRPGKPMLAARVGGKPVLGLPGNPVSVCTNTEIFVKPWLRRNFGVAPVERARRLMTLTHDCPRDPHRLFFVHAVHGIRNGGPVVTALPRQSSGNLFNPSVSNALIVLEPGQDIVAAGTRVAVLPIASGLETDGSVAGQFG